MASLQPQTPYFYSTVDGLTRSYPVAKIVRRLHEALDPFQRCSTESPKSAASPTIHRRFASNFPKRGPIFQSLELAQSIELSLPVIKSKKIELSHATRIVVPMNSNVQSRNAQRAVPLSNLKNGIQVKLASPRSKIPGFSVYVNHHRGKAKEAYKPALPRYLPN